ncbi:6-phospho 3-hexuloisomerase [Salinibacterium xinjiangense]|uniref:6-phospho-3-hexuloisomerase n=1 Tax=Salinibacterium xinjiangense TaxID=386302 RepID=A0A2C8Z6P4_9MICO|nr:6-phospho-3-hexuloisomerase [Salinibacterium xinjiangense]GGK92586.1 6-phospho 3-hexuloisomerase [Salinibacterium xinjiangense]SOE59360.1 6-phospho-3-hexuloisomerase [Salinibacterium xinjiangense]
MAVVNTFPVLDALNIIAREDATLVDALADLNPLSLERAVDELRQAKSIFVLGAGRSGLALRMTAMRLMHLGLTVHIVGEVTTPAIGREDLLLVASGSGTTEALVRSARTAIDVGATVITLTTATKSPLANISSVLIEVPAAEKLDRAATKSVQYAGSLFEQAVVTIGDAFFHSLWMRSGQSADDLWPRHANLE